MAAVAAAANHLLLPEQLGHVLDALNVKYKIETVRVVAGLWGPTTEQLYESRHDRR